ncbi:MAG: hypothetical protein Q9210_006714 [Variospora velana]
MAMRKLREAIVASARNDAFAKNVYIFIIRTTILLRHPESYHPAILHLLRRLHLASPLNDVEKKEFLGYWLLDLACRQQDLASAFRVRNLYRYRTEKVDMILSALIHGNWVILGLAKRSADVYETSLMQWADERMANYAMQCMGKSYLSLPKEYVERCTGLRWGKLKEQKKRSDEPSKASKMVPPSFRCASSYSYPPRLVYSPRPAENTPEQLAPCLETSYQRSMDGGCFRHLLYAWHTLVSPRGGGVLVGREIMHNFRRVPGPSQPRSALRSVRDGAVHGAWGEGVWPRHRHVDGAGDDEDEAGAASGGRESGARGGVY